VALDADQRCAGHDGVAYFCNDCLLCAIWRLGTGPFVPIVQANGTTTQLYQFVASANDSTGLQLTLGTNWVATGVYDFFIILTNATTPGLGTGPAWTNTTTRGFNLSIYNGLPVNSAPITIRTSNTVTSSIGTSQAMFVGSGYINGSAGQIDFNFGGSASGGSPASFGLWNEFNRIPIGAGVIDTGASYSTGVIAVRQARGATTMQIKFIVGAQEDSIIGSYSGAWILRRGQGQLRQLVWGWIRPAGFPASRC